MTHDLEIHNLAARGQLVQGEPRPASIQLTRRYECVKLGCYYSTRDAVQAIDHVRSTGHPIELTGAILAVRSQLVQGPQAASIQLDDQLDSFFKAVGGSQPERRVYQRKCLPPDRPAYERKGEGLPTHDAKFLLAYNCGTCSFNSNDAVAAVGHVLRTHHSISVVGSIQAVPVTVLDIPEHFEAIGTPLLKPLAEELKELNLLLDIPEDASECEPHSHANGNCFLHFNPNKVKDA